MPSKFEIDRLKCSHFNGFRYTKWLVEGFDIERIDRNPKGSKVDIDICSRLPLYLS